MPLRLALCALIGIVAGGVACSSSSNSNTGPVVTPTIARNLGTPVGTTLQGTPRPGQTPRATSTPASASACPRTTPSAGGIPATPSAASAAVTLPDGLQYQDFMVGTGATAQSGQKITMNYTGWLDDGTKFDSSLDRNMPFPFTLGAMQVIKGWDEGIVGMKVCGVRRLVIPGDLAYGASGRPPTIPPNARLTFDVQLVSIP